MNRRSFPCPKKVICASLVAIPLVILLIIKDYTSLEAITIFKIWLLFFCVAFVYGISYELYRRMRFQSQAIQFQASVIAIGRFGIGLREVTISWQIDEVEYKLTQWLPVVVAEQLVIGQPTVLMIDPAFPDNAEWVRFEEFPNDSNSSNDYDNRSQSAIERDQGAQTQQQRDVPAVQTQPESWDVYVDNYFDHGYGNVACSQHGQYSSLEDALNACMVITAKDLGSVRNELWNYERHGLHPWLTPAPSEDQIRAVLISHPEWPDEALIGYVGPPSMVRLPAFFSGDAYAAFLVANKDKERHREAKIVFQ